MEQNIVQIRRTLARWCILHIVLVYNDICPKIKRRFPEDAHLLQNGLISNSEYELYKATTASHGRWFVPIWWAANLLSRCHKDGLLSDIGLRATTEKLWSLRTCSGTLKLYAWINAPLRYIQITAFAVYGYFALMLITRSYIKMQDLRDSVSRLCQDGPVAEIQKLDNVIIFTLWTLKMFFLIIIACTNALAISWEAKDPDFVDTYFPWLLIIEFIFYMGWLKVAEENMDPFGTQDDDFSVNYLLDRVHHVSFMLVDELSRQVPDASDDPFQNNLYPRLRHTKASYPHRDHVPHGKFELPLNDDDRIVLPDFDHYAEPVPEGYRSDRITDKVIQRGKEQFQAVSNAVV